MSKNYIVSAVKPKSNSVIDTKPQNLLIKDTKPNVLTFDPQTATKSYQVVINASQYMGLPFLLTYPTAGTVTQWSEKG